jgi:hypothetical protein
MLSFSLRLAPEVRSISSVLLASSSMATDVDCPSCSQKLRVPDDLLGKKVKCPACKMMFLATAAGLEEPAPSRPVDQEERPNRAAALTASRRGTPPRERPASPDDEDDEDDRPHRSGRNLRRKRRDNYAPHRGVLILIFGILGLVLFLSTGIGFVLGIIAWIMGNNDLREIQAGRMDPEGEGMTQIGRILGMVTTILGIISLVVGCIFFVIWLIFVVGMIGIAAGAGGH